MRDNDIVFPHLSFAGPDSFYVTNDNFFHFDSTVMRSLWTFLLNYWLHCDVVFFDGFKGVEAIGGVHPNGITMDKDERLVRVSIKCGAQRPIGNSERKKKRVCASVVRFSKLMCCFQTLPQGLRFLCPVEWTIFFLNCKWFNNDGCLLDVVALGFFYIYDGHYRWRIVFHLFPAIVAWGNGRPFRDATSPHPTPSHRFPPEMMSKEQEHKFHTDDLSLYSDFCSASEWLRQISLAARKAINQKYFPEQGSDTSSVWNFCACSSNVIWRENQWRRLVSQVAAIAEIFSALP